jgi:cytochrome c peroxidase
MNMPSEVVVIERLSGNENYRKLFADAYPNESDPINFANVRNAIAAFERTLITPSKFDNYLNGDATALNEHEKKGLSTFMSEGCIACHTGSLVGGTMFQKFPLMGTEYMSVTGSVIDDKGKMEVTGLPQDLYMFKVPALRNVAETWPYLHDGSVAELNNTVTIMAKLQLGKELTAEQTAEITAFLQALTGEVPKEAQVAPEML